MGALIRDWVLIRGKTVSEISIDEKCQAIIKVGPL